jgi:SpoVK/Ycf46/Vps4 family AAA+-type ATPase
MNMPSDKTPFDQFVSHGRQGLVLWGPPGCGKSMIMQAIANQSGWPTLIVTPSLLQRKWFGDSTNQVRTLFGLVALLGRCTLVLDELDGLFRVRSLDEHDVSRELKTEWLQWWDGAASSNLHSRSKVVVVAATNRPWDIDPAVWRRLPQRFYVGVPTWDDRCDLMHKIVDAYKLPAIHPSVVEHLADSTEGYTPSDLFQILQCACRKGPMARNELELTTEDVQQALNEVPPTRFTTQYIHQLQDFLGVSNQSSQQRASEVSYHPDKPWFWQTQTPMGNFYEINVPVDSEVFDIMEDYLWKQIEWESSDEDYEEESEEEGDP